MLLHVSIKVILSRVFLNFMTETSAAAANTNSSEPPSKKQKIMSPSNGAARTAMSSAAFEQTSLLVQKLSPKGRVPTRGSPMSAGYDLYS